VLKGKIVNKLKNCPKCGGDDLIADEAFNRDLGKRQSFVECCSQEDGSCMQIIWASNEEEAIKKWNRIPRKVK
jgi:hypothetical protein